MPKRIFLFLLLAGFVPGAFAAVLPPEKLLPRDTVLVATVPDCGAAHSILTNTPFNRLWHDAALKPFKDKFTGKFGSDVLAPLERTLGVKFSSYGALAQGQATFALVPLAKPSNPEDHFARLFLLDTKDRAGELRTNLADIRQRWAAAGKPMKSQKIREMDFTTLIISAGDLSLDKLIPKPKDAAAADDGGAPPSTNKVELTFGQMGSLLLVSDAPEALEKILSRQSGGLVPALEEEPSFQSDYGARLRGAPVYVWINVKESIGILTRTPGGEGGDMVAKSDNPLVAFGLTGLTTASFAYRSIPEGLSAQFFLGAPEAKRRGLLNAFVAEAKEANPPPFVPADATKYWRWRLNLPHSWSQVETMLNDFNPQYSALLNFVLQSAGKDKDEHYDLKSELLANLGDDIIHYEKAPRGNTVNDLNSAPSIYLIGSPNPGKLVAALKTGLGIMGLVKQREFLGRQICTLTTQAQGAMPAHSLSFTGSGGYVALSGDADILEEYLRSDENKGRPLSDTPGLAEAAQRVGGMGTGLFGFDNQNASTRAVVETLRQQPITLQDILGAPPMVGSVNTAEETARLRDWADFSLLPPFDAISQYFYFSVFSGRFSPDGFTMSYFSPTPPKLR